MTPGSCVRFESLQWVNLTCAKIQHHLNHQNWRFLLCCSASFAWWNVWDLSGLLQSGLFLFMTKICILSFLLVVPDCYKSVVCVCVSVCTYLYVCLGEYVYMYECMYLCMYTCVCLCVCVYLCVLVWTCVCVHALQTIDSSCPPQLLSAVLETGSFTESGSHWLCLTAWPVRSRVLLLLAASTGVPGVLCHAQLFLLGAGSLNAGPRWGKRCLSPLPPRSLSFHFDG